MLALIPTYHEAAAIVAVVVALLVGITIYRWKQVRRRKADKQRALLNRLRHRGT